MSPNVGTPEGSRKRSHDEYSDGEDVVMEDAPATDTPMVDAEATATKDTPTGDTPTVTMTDAPARQPPKRKKPTQQEKEEKERERAAKAEEKARLAEEKAKAAEEKAKLAEERAKAAEEKRVAKEAEQRKKDEKRAAKEEEQRKKDEEQRKKDEALKRQQSRMASFFGAPKKVAIIGGSGGAQGDADGQPSREDKAVVVAPTTPTKVEKTEYQKRFQPFFIKPGTRIATRPGDGDDEAAAQRVAKLDEYVSAQQDGSESMFSANIRDIFRGATKCRGVARRPVRAIMEQYLAASELGDGTTVQKLRSELATIPHKTIAFREDVRPPYRGTATFHPHMAARKGMARLGRRPTSRGILPLQYDYDSEAEWVDEEEGEDLDLDDDDDEVDDDDDGLDGFLDDSEDAGLARHAFQGDMEPESSGLCFEEGRTSGGLAKFRMEFMLDSSILQHTHGFDPFSTEYWPDTKKKAPDTAALTTSTAAVSLSCGPPPTTTTTTTITTTTTTNTTTTPTPKPDTTPLAVISANTTVDPARLRAFKPEALRIFKDVITRHGDFTKATLEDMLHKTVPGLTKMDAKTMLATLAYPSGKGRGRVWALKEGV